MREPDAVGAAGRRPPSRRIQGVVLALGLGLLLPHPRGALGQAAAWDSLGVQIVTASRPAWRDGAGWRVASRPTISMGGMNAAEEYQFNRVSSARRLRDGSILVANSGSAELRFYDSRGRFQRTVGRRGRGPGDYVSLILVPNFADDSIIVYDPDLSRLSVLDASGGFVRLVRFAPSRRGGMVVRGQALGRMTDGSFLIRETGLLAPTTEGRHRGTVVYVRYDQSGSVDTLGSFVGDAVLVSMYGSNLVFSGLPFLPTAQAVAAGDRFFYGDTESFSIRAYTVRGELTRIVRRTVATRRLDRRDYDAWVTDQLATIRDARAQVETGAFYASLFQPWPLPAFGRLLVDVGRNLWVAEFRAPGSRTASAWSVFDAQGVYLGDVVMPPRFMPLEIGTDYVLGLRTGDADEEYVEMYALTRTPR